MKARFWGVRGSIPAPGTQTNRYGGNTSCVEICSPHLEPLIIDAGTGIRLLGKELMQGDFGRGQGVAHLLISHTHWDHIQGLPFFAPLYQAGNALHVYARQRDDTHLRAIFESQSEDPYFPVPFAMLKADVRFHELGDRDTFSIGPAKLRCTQLNHPWVAIAFRVELHGAAVVYVSDTAPFRDILLEHEFIARPPSPGAPLQPDDAVKLADMRAGVVDLCRDADLVIYDTHFTQEEYAQRPHWGHSTPDDGIAVALDAGARSLALFHHAPERTDDEQDAILARCRADLKRRGAELQLYAASEGLEIDVGGDG